MDGLLFAVEALVVVGAIVMGTRSSGVALGIWGGVGVAVLVFVFQVEPGTPPVDAILCVTSATTSSSTSVAPAPAAALRVALSSSARCGCAGVGSLRVICATVPLASARLT